MVFRVVALPFRGTPREAGGGVDFVDQDVAAVAGFGYSVCGSGVTGDDDAAAIARVEAVAEGFGPFSVLDAEGLDDSLYRAPDGSCFAGAGVWRR